MAYLVLARKFRPAKFDEIVGQEHVTRALKNAIRLDRVAHAFLFTGARGVGKTTAARVLAKALQCEKGPIEEPCGECSACTEIVAGSAIDVLEIDGASNRGINEIRELRDGIAYRPSRDRFKIYIIDEVHMLTSEAFNALLKTLEEPPRHVKFIFATTEPQKIPVTILSRCQRYDFKRVPLGQVKRHLDYILSKEEIEVAEEGVRMIARESEGSVRDALSLLDRVISFAGEKADAKAVADSLGIADRKWLVDLTRGMLSADTAAALGVISDVHHYGYDMRAFTADLLNTVRDLIVVKVCGANARAAELSDSEARALTELGQEQPITALQRMFQILLTAADDVAASRHPRLVLEMAIIKCTTVRGLQSVPDVLKRIEELEQRLTSGGPSPGGGGGSGGGGRPKPPARAQQPQRTPAPAPAAPQNRQPPPGPPPMLDGPPQGRFDDAPPMIEAPDHTASQTDLPPLTAEGWPDFVASIKGSDPLLASMLENAVVMSTDGGLILGVANKFYRTQLGEGGTHDRLKALLRAAHGLHTLELREVGQEASTIASRRSAKRADEITRRERRIENNPVTRTVIESMGAEVVALKAIEEFDDD